MKPRTKKIQPVVVAVIHDGKGKFLLTDRRAGSANDDPEVEKGDFWQLAGGEVEIGETLEKAVVREIKEEMGIDIEIQQTLPKVFTILRPRWHGILIHFICTMRNPDQKVKLNFEATKYGWFTIEEVSKLRTFPETVNVLKMAEKLLNISGRERT